MIEYIFDVLLYRDWLPWLRPRSLSARPALVTVPLAERAAWTRRPRSLSARSGRRASRDVPLFEREAIGCMRRIPIEG
eukprot:3422286-Heterocapsa_arctica.AAC.1